MPRKDSMLSATTDSAAQPSAATSAAPKVPPLSIVQRGGSRGPVLGYRGMAVFPPWQGFILRMMVHPANWDAQSRTKYFCFLLSSVLGQFGALKERQHLDPRAAFLVFCFPHIHKGCRVLGGVNLPSVTKQPVANQVQGLMHLQDLSSSTESRNV